MSAGMQGKVSPCPHRCFDDLGSAFAMGCLGGAVWHAISGARNAPRGSRLQGSYQQIVLRAPALGGNFAVWGGLFSAFECSLAAVRQKEDPINAISAGALTGGVLAIRAGPKAAFTNALIGGALLGLIEGLGFMIGRMGDSPAGHQAPAAPGMTQGVGMSSLFGGSGGSAPRNSLANMQPRRTFTSSLDDPAATMLSLEDESENTFRSKAETQDVPQAPSARALFFPNATFSTPVTTPVYASAVEFSADDFTFNDAEDFDDDH